MTDSELRFARTVALMVALGLVAALGGAPAHAADQKLLVSAVILARDTCQIGGDLAQLAFTADASSATIATASTSLRCSGTARATTVRISSDGAPATARVERGVLRTLEVGAVTTAAALGEGASGGGEDTVVLTIEP